MTKHEEILSLLPISIDSPIKVKDWFLNHIINIYDIDGGVEYGIWFIYCRRMVSIRRKRQEL